MLKIPPIPRARYEQQCAN